MTGKNTTTNDSRISKTKRIERWSGSSVAERRKAVNEASLRNASSSIQQCIIASGVQYNDPKSIATALNDYFASVGRTLAEKFSQSLNYVNLAKLNVAELPTVSFELRTISDSFVLQQICALKRNKAMG